MPKNPTLEQYSRYLRTPSIVSRIKILRSGVDWQTIYYDNTVTPSVYGAIKQAENWDVGGMRIRWVVRELPTAVMLRDEGWYVRVVDPDWEETGPIKRHPVEVQAQGRAFAGRVDIDRALVDIERYLGIEAKATDRIPGRVDLAADVWIKDGIPSAFEVYRTIICRGSPEWAKTQWATRARRRQTDAKLDLRAVGKDTMTVYLGRRDGIQLCIYHKSADFEGNTKELVEADWRAAGWDGTGLVVRFEFRISRESIRENLWPVYGNDPIPGSEICLDDLREALPDLWQTCLKRYRYAPEDGKNDTPRNRDPAPLWKLLEAHPPTKDHPGWGIGLTHIKRGFDVERLKDRAKKSLINIDEALGKDGVQATYREALEPTTENEQYRARTPWRGFKERWKHGEEDDDS